MIRLIAFYVLIRYKNYNSLPVFLIYIVDIFYKKIFTPEIRGYEYLQDINIVEASLNILLFKNLSLENELWQK